MKVRSRCIPWALNMALIRPQYSHEERAFMVLTYSDTRDLAETSRMFVEHYPDARHPSKSTILRNFQKYHQHGTSQNRNGGNSGRPRVVRHEQGIAVFRQSIADHPQQSARRNYLGIAKSSFSRLVKTIKFHPYKLQTRHALVEGDRERRINYCRWFLQVCLANTFLLAITAVYASWAPRAWGGVNYYCFHVSKKL